MISDIKDRRKKNDDDELSEHLQDAEIAIRQKSNVILEKIIQSETRNNNEKIFIHEFSKNNAVDYTALVKKKQAQNKNLKVKRKYQILFKRNKRLQIFFQNDKISVSIRSKRNVVSMNNNFFDEISQFKRQRSVAELKLTNLNFYYHKNYKKFKN